MLGSRTLIARSARWWAAPVALLALAGCTASDADADATSTSSDTGAAQSESSSSAGAEDSAAAPGTIDLGDTSLGTVLVDAEGVTLYMFDSDTQGGESTCYDQCATAWPPLVTDEAPGVGEGLDAALLGTVERTDGSMQVTYDGWPLYYWAQDAGPGDVHGQGVNDVWWVLDPEGVPVRG